MSSLIYTIYNRFYTKTPTLLENTKNMLDLIYENISLLKQEKKETLYLLVKLKHKIINDHNSEPDFLKRVSELINKTQALTFENFSDINLYVLVLSEFNKIQSDMNSKYGVIYSFFQLSLVQKLLYIVPVFLVLLLYFWSFETEICISIDSDINGCNTYNKYELLFTVLNILNVFFLITDMILITMKKGLSYTLASFTSIFKTTIFMIIDNILLYILGTYYGFSYASLFTEEGRFNANKIYNFYDINKRKFNLKSQFDILGIDITEDSKKIKDAYRKKALDFHPDRNPGKNNEMIRLNNAYDIVNAYLKYIINKNIDGGLIDSKGDLSNLFSSLKNIEKNLKSTKSKRRKSTKSKRRKSTKSKRRKSTKSKRSKRKF